MKRFFCLVLLVCLAGSGLGAEGYGFLWWAEGWRGSARVICVQTNRYGMALDVETLSILNLGEIETPKSYGKAVAESNRIVFALPKADLRLWVEVEGKRYRCVGAAGDVSDQGNYPVRLIESGRVAQRVDVLQLVFEDESGEQLQAAGRLEIVSWPDRLHFVLEVCPEADLEGVRLGIELDGAREVLPVADLAAGTVAQAGLLWRPGAKSVEREPLVAVVDGRTGAKLPVTYDALRGWHYVDLPEASWNVAAEPDRLDRFSIRVRNENGDAQSARVLFAFDGGFTGVTGLSPMLLDESGAPTGIPVQISKNWHRLKDRRFLYEGPWFHGFSEIEMAKGETWSGELVIAYARWGGVPAASHAQLSLVGWGVNQRWDEVAIGSWGESICYDPDVNLNRSIIDDIRPLMAPGMHNNGKWQWTVNVGGGDFLVYYDGAGKKQFLSRMRTAYLQYGPNLTKVVYAGQTPDGCMDARIEVSSPRCDDVNRSFHRIRYDVRKAMPFSRMAFYQLGSDGYNDHPFSALARGHRNGLVEEWAAPKGGKVYHRTGMVCAGEAPWFSLHGGRRNAHHPKGAWANRGLVVRSWKARLGGVDVPQAFAAVYGTENGIPSANVELVPPPDCNELLPGDFVEAEVELLIVATAKDGYYGPNKAFQAHLSEHADSWRPIHRLAKGNHLTVDVTRGTLRRRYPVEVLVDKEQGATCRILGGVGYVPVTFTGLPTRTGWRLAGADVSADAHVQIDFDGDSGTWSRTYNVNLDGGGEAGASLRLTREGKPGMNTNGHE
jgi:hypothetical protein